MAAGGARALAGRERLAKRLDRPNPCPGGRLCEIGLFQSSFIGSGSTSFFILDEHASDSGAHSARRLSQRTGRSVLATAAPQQYVAVVRVHACICPPWAFPP